MKLNYHFLALNPPPPQLSFHRWCWSAAWSRTSQPVGGLAIRFRFRGCRWGEEHGSITGFFFEVFLEDFKKSLPKVLIALKRKMSVAALLQS